MSSHTPGPWSLSGDLIVGAPEPRPNPKVEPYPHSIAKLCWDFDGDRNANGDLPWAKAKANGRLITAAPDLLLACLGSLKFLLARTYPDNETVSLVDTLSQVISSATGIPRNKNKN
jgi:hypothetical protein